MNQSDTSVVDAIAQEVRIKMSGDGSGHDWWHVYRVWKMAQRLALEEGADPLVVSLGALLHDIADWKYHDKDDTVGPRVAREILIRHGLPEDLIAQVCEIVDRVTFKGANVADLEQTIEGQCVRDADRLDALGAIGIARTFAYGGHKGRLMHDPDYKPVTHDSKVAYFNNTSPTIAHFYEKLLLLKDRLDTKAAKRIAESRHAFMEKYLDQFYREWEAEA